VHTLLTLNDERLTAEDIIGVLNGFIELLKLVTENE
jgi:hypothetical protein